jgi:hypothetical protein
MEDKYMIQIEKKTTHFNCKIKLKGTNDQIALVAKFKNVVSSDFIWANKERCRSLVI